MKKQLKEEFYRFEDTLLKTAETPDGGAASFVFNKETKKWQPVMWGCIAEAQMYGFHITEEEAEKMISEEE